MGDARIRETGAATSRCAAAPDCETLTLMQRCHFCERFFTSKQAVRAHLRFCDLYHEVYPDGVEETTRECPCGFEITKPHLKYCPVCKVHVDSDYYDQS